MKELHYHNSNLLSIKSMTNGIWSDKIFFKNLLKYLFVEKEYILMTGQRSYSSINDSFVNEVIKIVPRKNIINLDESKRNHNISFYHLANPSEDNLLELINDFWIVYEQPTLIITNNLKKYLSVDIEKMSWVDLCSISDYTLVIYRGIEEDVLWVGKSPHLNFPDMEKIMNFKPTLG